MADGFDSLLTSSWDDIQKFLGLNGQTTANTTGMAPDSLAYKTATTGATLKNAGVLTAIFGAASSAIGGYYQAQTQQYQLKSQASSLNFQANMDSINAREAEMGAQSIQEAGKAQIAQYTMREGQQQASETAGTAARGIDLSSGSAIAQRASNEVVKEIDTNTINANATRAAWAQRTTATNYSNEALLDRTGAANLTASASTISPFAAATTSLLGSASGLASRWDWSRQVRLAALNGSAS